MDALSITKLAAKGVKSGRVGFMKGLREKGILRMEFVGPSPKGLNSSPGEPLSSLTGDNIAFPRLGVA
jgi:hypothetical protein